MKETLEKLYGNFLERQMPDLTRRDTLLETPPDKALAVIGMRRVGKTYLCYQRIAELLSCGIERERILYLNFEPVTSWETVASKSSPSTRKQPSARATSTSCHCGNF